MKPRLKFQIHILLMLSLGISLSLNAALPDPVVIERGPHHRVLERLLERTLPDGRIIQERRSYTELSTCMHYWKDNQWIAAKEEIEIIDGYGVARQGQLSVIWAANLNTPGAIDLEGPDGRFRSHILGLAYTDRATGRSVLIAEPQDSIGEVAGNQVVYRDALVGDSVRAHVRFSYRRASFEQDIVIVTALAPPSAWGLNDDTSVLECWTEMLESPTPQKRQTLIASEADPQRRQAMVEPDLVDEHLWFGVMDIGPGQAFPMGAEGDDRQSIPVSKLWENVAGRTFLIERVSYRDIQPHVQGLPQAAVTKTTEQRLAAVKAPGAGVRTAARAFPDAPKKMARAEGGVRMANLMLPPRAFVLDYVTMINQTNQVLKGDSTYYVSGDVQISGLTTLCGGAVLKYTNTSSTRLLIKGPLDCRTTNYHPAIFTAKDDNTVGETIVGSTGTPGTSYYAARALDLAGSTTYRLHDLRFRHAQRALYIQASNIVELSHSQIGFSEYGVRVGASSTTNILHNVLIHDTKNAIYTMGGESNFWEHVTVHRVTNFRDGTAALVYLTNSLLIAVTNGATSANYVGGSDVRVSSSDSGIFQTVGAASYYLVTGSTNRNAGTTNIASSLAAELKKKTTYPPIVLPNGNVSTNLTLSPQAPRDTDLPDLGFHYDPIDFAIGGIYITNCTITVTSGTVVATFTTNATYSIGLANGVKFISEGTPLNPNRFVRYNTAQEQSNTNWSGGFYPSFQTWDNFPILPEIRFRFTDWSCLAQDIPHLNTYFDVDGVPPVTLRDCAFHSGRFVGGRFPTTATNCLFERVATEWLAYSTNGSFVRNSLFVGGSAYFSPLDTNFMSVRDTVFDSCSITQEWNFDNGWNGYTTNLTRLTPNSANDVLLAVTNVTYEIGPLGRYYLPTNSPLINTGSVSSAASVGFYHYTVTTNQVKETNSWLDIGLHYVAVNASGQPIDTDGDGWPDYLEDSDGDGTNDTGETGWQSADTDGDGVNDWLERLLGRNPLIAGTTNDFNGSLNLRRYTPLK